MKFQSLKGFDDIYPPEIYTWEFVYSNAIKFFNLYGFQQMLLPMLENTDLFCRGIGDSSDIVEKEMYTFTDKGGRSVTMRPEGTASAVRCYIEHSLYNLPAPQKFFYFGPMFRYERPQKGRLRQFYQIGAEVFGAKSANADAEVIILLFDLLHSLGLKGITLEINSIGCEQCRPVFKKAIVDFIQVRIQDYCQDCQRRTHTNPLRILDCKIPTCVSLRQGAPCISEFLCEGCNTHFSQLKTILQHCNIKYSVNPQLVRGLDYYTKTTFEMTSNHLGSQNAVAAGGRYDRLVEELGGPATSAIGFAIGMERLCSLISQEVKKTQISPKAYIIALTQDAALIGLSLSRMLRQNNVYVEYGYAEGSLKSQLRKADKLGVRFALIIGEDEISHSQIQCKNLEDKTTFFIAQNEILQLFADDVIHPY